MIKALQAAFVALFGLMIWAPTLEERLHLVDDDALDENRRRTPRPTDVGALLHEGGGFARRYEAYFDDTFGFRDLLVRSKNQLDYSLFGENDKVLVGKDGWLFYKAVDDAEYEIEQIQPERLERIIERLEALNAALSARGMTLVVLPCPTAGSIYPEALPVTAARRPSPTGFERFRAALRRHPEMVTLDPTPLLLALKSRFRVYHKTDFHWTDPAAAHVAKELVNELGELSGTGPLWDQSIEVESHPALRGGEASMMGLLFPIREDAVYLRAGGIRQPPEPLQVLGPNQWIFESTEADRKHLPSTFLFGDSFANAFEHAGMRRYFTRLQKHHVLDFKRGYATIPDGTRFVIFELIEPWLSPMAKDDFWPELGPAAPQATPAPRPRSADSPPAKPSDDWLQSF